MKKLNQVSNFRRYRCSNHFGDCGPSMGERYACSQQSRSKRNTGINGARPNPTASRSHHRNGALTASYQNLAYLRYRSLSLNVSFGSMLSKKSVFGFESVAPCPSPLPGS